MGTVFRAQEVISLGIRIEENGRDFYRTLCARYMQKEAQELFSFLAREEERHIATFNAIGAGAEEYVPPESYPGEAAAYLKDLAARHIFTKERSGELLAQMVQSVAEALDRSIVFEEDSVALYTGIRRLVPTHEQKVVDELIAQERSHVQLLMRLKESL